MEKSRKSTSNANLYFLETFSLTFPSWFLKVPIVIQEKFFCVKQTGHFTVVYSVTRPMNGSEAAGDLVLIQTIRKVKWFASKEGHRQPRCHSTVLRHEIQDGGARKFKSENGR